jgi:chromosome partitioning protein
MCGTTMQVIAIENQKGGTGKTTTTVSLAACLAEAGLKVLVLDMDEQGSATSWLNVVPAGKGIYSVIADGDPITSHVYETGVSGIDVVPSSPFLSQAERAVYADSSLSLSPNMILKKAITKIPDDLWDYVLIDCPPALSVLTKNALIAASGVIIPVETQYMALEGLSKLLDTIKAVKEELNQGLEIIGILACRHQSKLLNKEVLGVLRANFGTNMFDTVVRENVKISEAPSHKTVITVYAPKCPAAVDYRAVASEVIARTRAVPVVSAANE